jgi:DNA-binding transcriptional regulator YiaG
MPVILDDAGKPMDYRDGIREIRRRLGVTASELAPMVGVSVRAVENWEYGRPPSAQALNALGLVVKKSKI